MTLDKDAIVHQLQQIEQQIHARGWDQKAQLRLMYNHPDIGPTDVDVTAPDMLKGNPGDAFEGLVGTLISLKGRGFKIADAMLDDLRREAPGCYAVVLVSEMYANFEMTEEQAYDYEHNPRSPKLVDRPNSQEVRMVSAYDRAGRLYSLIRIRGKAPEPVEVYEPHQREHGTAMTGRMPEVMAKFMALIVGEDPDAHAENATLPEWLRPRP